MLAISALSGKFAEPMTIGAPPAAAEPEPDPAAAAEVAADALELLASGSEEPPQADKVSAAASPAATSALPRVRSGTNRHWCSLVIGPAGCGRVRNC